MKPTTNNLEGWEEFRLKLHNVYATVFQLSGYSKEQLKEKEDVMVQFISDLRKNDMEELIKIYENNYDGEGNYTKTIEAIKEYYSK